MVLPQAAAFTDLSLLLLRLLIAALFASSGWSHLTRPEERGDSVGLPPAATVLLGAAELAGAASVALGVFVRLGALLLV